MRQNTGAGSGAGKPEDIAHAGTHVAELTAALEEEMAKTKKARGLVRSETSSTPSAVRTSSETNLKSGEENHGLTSNVTATPEDPGTAKNSRSALNSGRVSVGGDIEAGSIPNADPSVGKN